MRKIWSVFARDVRIGKKDPMALWIFACPIVMAILINLLAPGMTDTTVNLAVGPDVDSAYRESMEEFAHVEVFDNRQDVEERILDRDEVVGIVMKDGKATILAEGNESEGSLKMAQILNSLYEEGVLDADNLESRLSFYSFNEKVPHTKGMLAAGLLLMTTIIAAMMTTLGVVDEKNDKTIQAAKVTPMSPMVYLLSKSIIGFVFLILTCFLCLLILGLTDINWGQMTLLLLVIGLLSIMLSFVAGLASSDFIEAATSLKMLMVPMFLAILVYEFLNEKWHFTMYWNPFYWAYRGVLDVLNHTAGWAGVAGYSVVILVICAVVYLFCRKNVKKYLN